jgi:hypothetical protein
VPDLKRWYDNNSGADGKNKTWFYPGDFKNLTKTVKGITISGSLDDEKYAKFTIDLSGNYVDD